MRSPLALTAAALLAVACSDAPSAPPAPKFASCVAFALDGEHGIEAHEIDAASVYVERLEPAASPNHLRRLAFTNVVLPRHVARLLDPEAHAKAKSEARTLRDSLAAGTFTGPVRPDGTIGEVLEGGFGELGILPWGVALDLPDNEWSEPIEEVGAFIVLRRLGRTEAPVPMATTVKLEAFVFHWLPPETVKQRVDSAYDEHQLTVVDPAWADIAPAALLHRMQGRLR